MSPFEHEEEREINDETEWYKNSDPMLLQAHINLLKTCYKRPAAIKGEYYDPNNGFEFYE